MAGKCDSCGCGSDLQDAMEFDHPVRVDPDGTLHDRLDGVYAPELIMGTDGDGQILAEHEADYKAEAARQGWELLEGFTGQHAYRGPVMHPSEYIGGRLADHIRETPGTYAVIAVETDDDDDEAAGWAIAFRPPAEPSYGPNEDGSPYASNTPEHRVWTVAQDKGQAAASWVFDGNTTQETYRRFIRGIADGDPEVLDSVREPSLSGEFADDYSEDQLMTDVGWVPHDGTDMRDDLATQYNDEVSTAFWTAVERAALRGFDHAEIGNETQLGNRFITCSCGERFSGGIDPQQIAERNFAHHLKTTRES